MTDLRVLFVEDVSTEVKLVLRELGRMQGRRISHAWVQDEASMRAALGAGSFDVVLCDWSMPRFSALEALAVLHELELDLPFVIVSGTVDEATAVDAMRAGATDYVLKDNMVRLVPAIERGLRERELREAARKAQKALRESEEARRRGEDQLRQAQKMEAVGRLAGGVAHDFNNALSVVLSYAELLLGAMEPHDPKRDDVLEIRTAAKRAATLTRQLLLFSRRQVLEPRVIDMNKTLLGLHEMLGPLVGADVDFSWKLAPALGSVRADLGSIEQVVMNLVVNARDAMPRGGVLTIATADVDLDEDQAREVAGAHPGPHVMFSVTDTGIGMDKATQDRIFEPFFTTKDVTKGSGLGLSTVHGIVQQSGGCIRVRSAPAAGATFEIYLPRLVGSTTDAGASAGAGVHERETILLAEDDAQVRGVVRGVLRRQGYEVLEAQDPADAVKLAKEHPKPIHLLLTDVVMPQMSGPELSKHVTAMRPDIRVLYMSGYTDDSVLRHGVKEADVAYLQKPVTPQRIALKVRAVLDGK